LSEREPTVADPEPDYDTRFSLPAVHDPPSVEVGVILLGLGAERLLAGLGVAALGDDPARVTLLVDQLRHGLPTLTRLDSVIEDGARRWGSARTALTAADRGGRVSAAVRQAWSAGADLVATAELGDAGPATRAYLTACWLRRTEVDRYLEDRHALPLVAP
jgi:Family of unknown function (DUF6187)